MYLTKSAKAPNARIVPDHPSLNTVHIEWVPLGDLDVPPALSEIGDTPPDSRVDDSMGVVPPPPAGEPHARPVPADAVLETPPAPERIDLRREAPRIPLLVVFQTSGVSVSFRVTTGLLSDTIPAVSASGAVTLRDAHRLDVHIPPGFVAIVAPGAPVASMAITSAPLTGALGLNAPFDQSKYSERDRVVLLAEFGGIRINREEVFEKSPPSVWFCDHSFQTERRQRGFMNCCSVLEAD